MAEILLKVGDTPTYQDGDILCAFTDKHISCVHAQNICNHRHIGFKPNGLRDTNTLTFKMFQEFYEYMFQRVSTTEVKRILISDSSFEMFSDKTEKTIYVEEYIKRRLKHSTHLIFGETGSEIWFGGKSDFSQTKIDNIWSQITAFTGKLKSNHNLWPCGTRDLIDHFAIKLDTDLLDEDAQELVASETEEREIEGEIQEVIIKKRKNFITWQAIDVISPVTIGHINDLVYSVDGRKKSELTLSNIKEVK